MQEKQLLRDVKTKLGGKDRQLPLGETELDNKLGIELEQLPLEETELESKLIGETTARGDAEAGDGGVAIRGATEDTDSLLKPMPPTLQHLPRLRSR